MENPFGHHHHHHHHHQEEDNERERPNYPPPGTTFPAFDQPPPPPPPYVGFDEPPIPPPAHVFHSSSYPPPPPEDFERQPPPFDSFGNRHQSGYGSVTVEHVDHHRLDQPPSSDYFENRHQSGYGSVAVEHVAHDRLDQPPPSDSFGHHHPSGYGSVTVEHVDHHRLDQPPIEEFDGTQHHHHHIPHFPSFGHHHEEHLEASSYFSGKKTFQVYSKAGPNFSLAIRDGKVILARSDYKDDFQHWYKDEKYSTRVKDEDGFPCFALVNKATGQAMKHSVGDTHPVQLTAYNQNVLDESILWTESKDLGDGYRTIRMVNNIHLLVDAFHGDKHSGGVHDGTLIVLWKWNKGDNQRWKIIAYCKFPNR